jgi:HEAT repeat protein
MASLASPDPVVRARAVQTLGDRREPSDLGYLVGRVSDPDAQVRQSVALALGAFDDRRAAEALAKLVSDSAVSVQLVAVSSLAKQKGPRAHAHLLLAYEQGDCAVRARVVEALASGKREPAEAVQVEARSLWLRFSKALSRGSSAERIAAAEELGSSGRPEAVERLASYLGAESAPLAIAAARGLGASGSQEARVPLEAMLSEESVDLQVAGAEALGMLGELEAVEALARVVPHGGRTGMAAVAALERLLPRATSHRDSRPESRLLCAALLVEDEDVSARMGRLLKAAGWSCDVRPLLGRMQLAGPTGQAALAALLQLDIGADASLTRRLAEILRSGPASSRPLAARFVGRLGLRALQPNLERVFTECAAQLKRSRLRWIVAPGDGGASIPESLFAEESPDVEAAYAEAGLSLVRLQAPAGEDTARELANDPAPSVRGRAAEAATVLPAAVGWPLLRGLLDDRTLVVRDRALEVLGDFDRGSPEPGRWLLEALRKGDGQTEHRMLIALLAKRPPTPGAVEVLTEALRSPETAGAAAAALGHQDPALATPVVVARLAELPTAGLMDLIQSASAMQLKAALPSLVALRFCPRPEVAATVAAALWKLDPEHAAVELSPLAEDYYLEVRRSAAGSPPG